jgi:hypothetical protein
MSTVIVDFHPAPMLKAVSQIFGAVPDDRCSAPHKPLRALTSVGTRHVANSLSYWLISSGVPRTASG